MPTLLDMLLVFKDQNILINIELKGPLSLERKKDYDFQLAAQIVYDIIQNLQIQDYVMVSSFVPETLIAINQCLKSNKNNFLLCQLMNRKNLPEAGYLSIEGMDGINISATYLTEEIVAQTKSRGQTIGVWLSRNDTKETEELYQLVFGHQVDFIFLDCPLLGMRHRD